MRIHARHACTRNVDVDALEAVAEGGQLLQLELGIAVRGVGSVVFESVQVLVTFPADFASVGLLLLHADGSGVGNRCEGVDDGEGAVVVLLELLVLVTVLYECQFRLLRLLE